MLSNQTIRSVLVSSIGNLLEWYDFGLFATFAVLFSQLFFPKSAPHVALIEIFGVYALGFVCRPLGGLFFGYIGDRFGRVKTLRTSIVVMSLPTLLIAFLPTYDRIGLWAPLCLVSLRLIQGISLGGEFTGTIIYLAESAPAKHRALWASFAGTFANVGFLLANGVAAVLLHVMTHAHFNTYGWRIAFAIGGCFGFSVCYVRRILLESPAFLALHRHADVDSMPARDLLSTQTCPRFAAELAPANLGQTLNGCTVLYKMLLTLTLVMLGGVLYYMSFVYFFNMLQEAGLSRSTAYTLQACFLGLMLMLVPLGGMLCDRLGRRTSFLLLSAGVILFALPGFHLLQSPHLVMICLGLLGFVLLSSFEQGTTSATVVEQFPVYIRMRGLSFSYNLTQALFGGTAPMVAAYLAFVCHNAIAPAYYLIAVAAVTFLSSWFFL